MHLVSSLCSGFAAAANGHAELYIRDTSTRATWYGSFEGDSPNSTGANITLDAYGAAEVYVNQLVDIVIKNVDGVQVRAYTDGYASPNIEVDSPSFTGTPYAGGGSAVSEPTTLQAVLNLWTTNAGAPDWKVAIGGSATTLQNAFGATTGLVFNVKSPAYGAIGDGVTNDQAAIASALAAAVAAGGGVVFFPRGTYLISTAIEWDHRVSILGVGGDLSTITTNSASNARILTWTTGTAQNQAISITGMSFASTVTNTGEQIYSTVAVNLLIDNCNLGSSATATGILLSVAGASNIILRDTTLRINSGSNHCATWTSTTKALIIGCTIKTVTTTFTGSFIKVHGTTKIVSTVFDYTSLTSAGTVYGVENLNGDNKLTVEGCEFRPLAQTITACFRLLANSLVMVSGIDFSNQNFSTYYSVTGILEEGSYLQLFPSQAAGGADAAYTVGDAVSSFELTSSGTVPLITLPTMLFPGQELKIFIENTSGGGWAAISTAGAADTVTGFTLPTIANTETGCCFARVTDFDQSSDTYVWLFYFGSN